MQCSRSPDPAFSWGRSECGSVPVRPCTGSGPARGEPHAACRAWTKSFPYTGGWRGSMPGHLAWPRQLTPGESLPGGMGASPREPSTAATPAPQGSSCGTGRTLGFSRGRQGRASLSPHCWHQGHLAEAAGCPWASGTSCGPRKDGAR